MHGTAHLIPGTVKYPCHTVDVFHASLDASEVGAVVIDSAGHVVFMNDTARMLLQAPDGGLPLWTERYVCSIMDALVQQATAIERWEHDHLFLRVRARPLGRLGCTVLEIAIARSVMSQPVAHKLSRSLRLRRSEAQLLELLWCGLNEEEIARHLGMCGNRLNSRLKSLYRKLRVEVRPAAVLRAAQALAA